MGFKRKEKKLFVTLPSVHSDQLQALFSKQHALTPTETTMDTETRLCKIGVDCDSTAEPASAGELTVQEQ